MTLYINGTSFTRHQRRADDEAFASRTAKRMCAAQRASLCITRGNTTELDLHDKTIHYEQSCSTLCAVKVKRKELLTLCTVN